MSILQADSLQYVQERLAMRRTTSALALMAANIDDVDVSLTVASNNSSALIIVAVRPMGSDVGLRVFASSNLSSTERFSTHDADFDGIFARDCASGAERDAAAIVNADVRAAMNTLQRVGSASLFDDSARVLVSPSLMSGPELESVIRSTVHAAKAADRATEPLGVPIALAPSVAQALTVLAGEHALAVRTHPFSLRGSLAGDEFSLRFITQYTARKFSDPLHGASFAPGFDCSLRFAEPLRGGLSARPASLFDRAQSLIGFGDIETGDAAFDRAWTLQARVAQDPDRAIATALVREQLNETARALLTQLRHARVELSFDERMLVGRGPLIADAATITAVFRALAALRTAFKGAREQRPYR